MFVRSALDVRPSDVRRCGRDNPREHGERCVFVVAVSRRSSFKYAWKSLVNELRPKMRRYTCKDDDGDSRETPMWSAVIHPSSFVSRHWHFGRFLGPLVSRRVPRTPPTWWRPPFVYRIHRRTALYRYRPDQGLVLSGNVNEEGGFRYGLSN